MKNIYLLLATLLCSVSFVACSDDAASDDVATFEGLVIGTDKDVNASIDGRAFNFDARGGRMEFRVKTSSNYAISTDADWISFNRVVGSATNYVGNLIIFDVAPNESEEARSAMVVVTAGGEHKQITVEQAGVKVEVVEKTIVDRLGLGWSMNCHFDAYDGNTFVSGEDLWGNQPCTQKTMDAVRAAGFNSVRIPITWSGHFDTQAPYTVEQAWLDRIYEVVTYVENAGLCAVINMHYDCHDGANWLDIKNAAKDAELNKVICEKISSIWHQVALRFADKGDFLVFESFDNINDGRWGWGENITDGGKQYATLNTWNQLFVDAVRSAGGCNADRYLGVTAYNAEYSRTTDAFVLPTDAADNRILLAFHFFEPQNFSRSCQDETGAPINSWGHTVKKPYYNSNEASLLALLDQVKRSHINKGLQVYISEMGCVNRQLDIQRQYQRYYLEYLVRACREYGIPCFAVDHGKTGFGSWEHGFLQHGTGDYLTNPSDPTFAAHCENMVKAMVRGWNNNYSLNDVYNSCPSVN